MTGAWSSQAPGRRGSPAGGDRRSPVRDGPAPVAGEDPDHPHRRGPRLPRLAHPTSPQARHQPALRLHLPGEEGPAGRHRQGKTMCRQDTNQPLDVLLHPAQPGAAGLVRATSGPGCPRDLHLPARLHLGRVFGWLRRKHRRITWKELRRRYCGGGWWPADGEGSCSTPTRCGTTRYRYRGAAIPGPWPSAA